METHQKDIEEKDPFGQNRADEADDGNDEKSFLKALLAERALKYTFQHKDLFKWKKVQCTLRNFFLLGNVASDLQYRVHLTLSAVKMFQNSEFQIKTLILSTPLSNNQNQMSCT